VISKRERWVDADLQRRLGEEWWEKKTTEMKQEKV